MAKLLQDPRADFPAPGVAESWTEAQEAIVKVLLKRKLRQAMEANESESYVRNLAEALRKVDEAWSEEEPDQPMVKSYRVMGSRTRTRRLLARAREYKQKK